MEHKTLRPMTEIDDFATSSIMYTLKCTIPYLPLKMQRSFALCIKYHEFRNIYDRFHGFRDRHDRSDLINQVKSSLDPESFSKLEQLLNMIHMLEIVQFSESTSDIRSFFQILRLRSLTPIIRYLMKYFRTIKLNERRIIMSQWIKNPKLKTLDPVKLELLKTAAQQTEGKSGKNLVPILFALITSANQNGMAFSPDEFSLIVSILKEGKDKDEQQKIDQIIRTVNSYKKTPKSFS